MLNLKDISMNTTTPNNINKYEHEEYPTKINEQRMLNSFKHTCLPILFYSKMFTK